MTDTKDQFTKAVQAPLYYDVVAYDKFITTTNSLAALVAEWNVGMYSGDDAYAKDVLAAAGLLPQGESASQSFGNKLPVNSVNCAATFTVPPTNNASSPNFETMRQYFYAQAAARQSITSLSLEERMMRGRACAYKYIETNSIIKLVSPTGVDNADISQSSCYVR